MIKTENVNTNVNESADFKCSEALVYVYQNDNKNNAALGDRRNSYVICERSVSVSVSYQWFRQRRRQRQMLRDVK